jgi:hypothetical protein
LDLDQPAGVAFTERLQKILPHFLRNVDFRHGTPAKRSSYKNVTAPEGG